MNEFNVKELENMLNPILEIALTDEWDSDKLWTSEIKKLLCDAALKRDLYVCSSGTNNATYGEWLYDVTWLETYPTKKNTITVKGCPLVAECEWGDIGDIRDDFQKLLLARADARVMIFQANHSDAARKIIDMLIAQIIEYRHSSSGDRYIFAVYTRDDKKFFYKEHVHA